MPARFLLFSVAFATLACGCEPRETQTSRFRVVTTTTLIADAARRVGGEFVEVDCLMGPGIDPHRYTPTPGDLRKLTSAGLILYHGLHLEGKLDDVLARAGSGKAVAVAERLSPGKLIEADGDGPHDPHVWMDPLLWIEVVNAVRDALAAAMPQHAEAIAENARRFAEEIAALHVESQRQIEQLPPARRILVTSHDAFAYFGRAYGFEVRGLLGVSTVAESSTRDVQDLADFLGRNRVPAVFAETSVPPKGLQTVLDIVRKQHKHTVTLVGGEHALYSDALGPPGSPGETYLNMFRHNVATIVNALR